jgi:inorganic triphosphatase YgiF
MAISREVELKLELPIAEAARLPERSFNRLEGNQGIKQHLVSVYFDTGKHALRKHGLTLRIRSGGKRRIQTIKAVDTASACIFDRLEWETEIKGDKPDLIAATRTPVGDVLHGSRASKLLAPIFKTVVDRTTWNVKHGGSEIEVALDEGRVSAHGSTRPIAEVEFELKRGSPTDLFALARSLDCVKDLEIGVLSKSERGYALVDGDEPRSFKAEPIALEPNLSAAEAFQNIARACIRHFRLNEPLLIARRSAEPLHQARVAIRRLRSALSLFEPVVTDQKYKRLKRRLRDVSHQFGEARNLDVYIAHTTVPDVDKGGQLPPFALTLSPGFRPAHGVLRTNWRAKLRVIKTSRILQPAYSSDVDATSSSMAVISNASHQRSVTEFGSKLRSCDTLPSSSRNFLLDASTVSDTRPSSPRSVTCRLGLATSMISRTSRKSRQSWLVIRPLRLADLAPGMPRLVVSAIRTSAPLHCSSQLVRRIDGFWTPSHFGDELIKEHRYISKRKCRS